jgi:hypothetical protein
MRTNSDWMDGRGAAMLAARIKDYWRSRGYVISTSIIEVHSEKAKSVFCVRSNLYNGLPPRECAAANDNAGTASLAA